MTKITTHATQAIQNAKWYNKKIIKGTALRTFKGKKRTTYYV